ncbi:MAG: 2-amino-4-hydroxy-6-hydroxymethyldihydropteridine diphosphokinase [Phycisphaerae bacterium]|nr:2-amino-4-hydroxy-6-hydroxymethyldihydropteridine diphosphokinase [Phycisphaerae bacterium]
MRAAIAIGTNVGDRAGHVRFAFEALARLPSTLVKGESAVIETAPVGPADQGAYLNAVVLIETLLPARELLGHLLAIERERGRDRSPERRWGPRTLDLDLLLYGGAVIVEPGLSVPHPRLRERRFVLEPLVQVAPDMPVPPDGATVSELLGRLVGPGRGGDAGG